MAIAALRDAIQQDVATAEASGISSAELHRRRESVSARLFAVEQLLNEIELLGQQNHPADKVDL